VQKVQKKLSDKKKIHFIGIGGVGMSGLAQVARWQGEAVSGSDRFFDRGEASDLRTCLEGEGIAIFPQDGSGLVSVEEAVTSVAVEADIPDLIEAKRRGVPVMSRGEYLWHLARGKRTLAVAGTNGKSTTTALLGWILEQNGCDPTFVIGAPLKGERKGWGNARLGRSEWFCFEADESDGMLDQYQPSLGVITNISPDHFPIERLREIFSRFARNCRDGLVLNADCPESRDLLSGNAHPLIYSIRSPSDLQARKVSFSGDRSTFELSGEEFALPLPGLHNIYNALAAIAAASRAGITLDRMTAALQNFPGLKRRMEVVYSSGELVVIDDYSHNPAKITAALTCARLFGPRVTAVYQPHGFAPLRRLHRELAAAFSRGLRKCDRLFILPVYYAGGTIQSGFGSRELAAEIAGPAEVLALPGREELLSDLVRHPRSGEVILIMGARDPTLSDLARRISRQLSE